MPFAAIALIDASPSRNLPRGFAAAAPTEARGRERRGARRGTGSPPPRLTLDLTRRNAACSDLRSPANSATSDSLALTFRPFSPRIDALSTLSANGSIRRESCHGRRSVPSERATRISGAGARKRAPPIGGKEHPWNLFFPLVFVAEDAAHGRVELPSAFARLPRKGKARERIRVRLSSERKKDKMPDAHDGSKNSPGYYRALVRRFRGHGCP